MQTKQYWIDALSLLPHPEGGYYKQIEKSRIPFIKENQERALYTYIHFLLDTLSPSHFHRLAADEIWFFHAGNPLTVHCIYPDGSYEAVALGTNLDAGQSLSFTVPKGTIFGSTVEDGYALVSCVVAPGFEFSDFELFTSAELLAQYPQHETIIKKLAYEQIPE